MKIYRSILLSFSLVLVGLNRSNSDIIEFLDFWITVRDKPKHIRIIFDGNSTDNRSITQEIIHGFSKFSTVESFDLFEFDKIASTAKSNFQLIITNSKDNLLNFIKTIDNRKFQISGYFLIFTSSCSINDDGKLFDLAWSRYIVNMNIACHKRELVSLHLNNGADI